MTKLRLKEEVQVGHEREAATVLQEPAVTRTLPTPSARLNIEEKRVLWARQQKVQFWGQVFQTVVALVSAVGFAFMMQSIPTLVGAMGGVAFVSNLVYRGLVWQHYFRTGTIIYDGQIGNPLRFYVFPALTLAIIGAMMVPLMQAQASDDEPSMLWMSGFIMAMFVMGALFFVALAAITLRRRVDVR